MTTAQEQGALWVPIARQLPLHLVKLGQMSTMMIENKKFVADMAEVFGGRAAKPAGVMTIPSIDNTTPIMVAGLGGTEVAELEDIALEAMEKDEEQYRKTHSAIDHAAERERRGAPTAESFDTRFREAMQARADHGRRNIRTALTTPYDGRIEKGQAMSVVPHNYPGGR